MRVQNKNNRSFLDITSLRNRQPPCHTESHHFVTRSHDCLKMQGFYSSVQRKTGKKLSPNVLQRWRLFLFRVSWFFTRFHSRFLLIIAVISTKRLTNEGVWEEDLNLFFKDTGKIKSCFYTLFLEKKSTLAFDLAIWIWGHQISATENLSQKFCESTFAQK